MDCVWTNFKQGLLLGGRFQTISPLNHGSYGMVSLAKDIQTGEMVALKCLTKSTSEATSGLAIDERSEELTIHSRIGHHPNIVNLLHSFETETHTYLVLEYCANGDLYEAIRTMRGPQETENVRELMLQLVGAVEFLHSKGLYHRDIKPENVFLSQTGSIKLGDFGLATMDKLSFECAVGSDRYMAPEQLDPSLSGYSPEKADIWAIGICLLNVLFSRNPFACPIMTDPLFADFLRDRQSLFDIFPKMSYDTFDVLMQCLVVDPTRRSLANVREALERVVSFTTDDELLDEFCTEDREIVGATANREPLRTPSISAAQPDQGAPFPWAKALQMTPQQPVRPLSSILDVDSCSEDLFPASDKSDRDWFSVKPDDGSVSSVTDSGLGVSFKSVNPTEPIDIKTEKSEPIPIAGSTPSRSILSSIFGKRDSAAKSWSDMWDEEEELMELERENTIRPCKSISHLRVEKNSGRKSVSSSRRGLKELKNPLMVHNSRNRSPRTANGCSSGRGVVGSLEPKLRNLQKEPLSSRRSAMDKWAALGDRRREARQALSETLTPTTTPSVNIVSGNVSSSRKRARSRLASWRLSRAGLIMPSGAGAGLGLRKSTAKQQKFDNLAIAGTDLERHDTGVLSKDWRANASPTSKVLQTSHLVASYDRRAFDQQIHKASPYPISDDMGDFEWGSWLA